MTSNSRIELCLATHHFFPTHGGAQLRFLRYFPGFRNRGIYPKVVTGTPETKDLLISKHTQKWFKYAIGEVLPPEQVDGTPISRIRLPNNSGLRRSIIFNQAVVRFCQQPGYRPQVVQLLSSLPPRTLPWLIQLRRLGFALVYAYTAQPKIPTSPFKRAVRIFAHQLLSRQLNCVIVQSTVMRDLLVNLGIKTQIVTIPNGVDLQRFRPVKEIDEKRLLRASLGIRDNDKVIITVGTLTAARGGDLVVKAWAKLSHCFPEAHLVVVGPIFDKNHSKRGAFQRYIDDLVKASGAAERIHFPGFVENVEDYLRASDLFAFSPIKGAMPNVVLEAMASGLPVILTPFAGLPAEFGKPAREYFLAKRQSNTLSKAIATILQNDELGKKLGQRGRSWVERTMDVEKSLDQYAALYKRLADQMRK